MAGLIGGKPLTDLSDELHWSDATCDRVHLIRHNVVLPLTQHEATHTRPSHPPATSQHTIERVRVTSYTQSQVLLLPFLVADGFQSESRAGELSEAHDDVLQALRHGQTLDSVIHEDRHGWREHELPKNTQQNSTKYQGH